MTFRTYNQLKDLKRLASMNFRKDLHYNETVSKEDAEQKFRLREKRKAKSCLRGKKVK